jgi:hypothetical protein
MKVILSSKRHHYMVRVSTFLITIALIAGMVSCGPPSQNLEIRTWYDLDAVRNNLGGSYILMNDLDSTTYGYDELASETANNATGWQPIGTYSSQFTGTFDGKEYQIEDLFINRPSGWFVGLFGIIDEGGQIEDVGVVNATMTGDKYVGGLVGRNEGTVTTSYFTGNVTGRSSVGGLVGSSYGTVSNSYSSGKVNGGGGVGGLVGYNYYGTVSNSYFTGNVTGDPFAFVGGLLGYNKGGTVNNSYSSGGVDGIYAVGGLVGANEGNVSDSYSTGSVTGDENVGGLVGANEGNVSNSFWDTETSGQATSDGGTGKNTTGMQDILTFLGAGWDIIVVYNPNDRDTGCIWNIINGVTYPFLSWQP